AQRHAKVSSVSCSTRRNAAVPTALHGTLTRAATGWLTAVAGGLCLGLAAACSPGAGPPPQPSSASPPPPPPPPPTARQPPPPLQVTGAAYPLPSAISREVVLARDHDLLIIGGITQQLTTTSTIIQLNPVTGRVTRAGHLADPAHDAAGAVLGGRPYLFGGGD